MAGPDDMGPRLLAGSCPPHFQAAPGRNSPCCRSCMFLSDHLHFLKREHGVIGSWLSPPVAPALGRKQTWLPFATGLEYGGRIDRLF